MNSYGVDTWMRAGREIEGAYQRHGAPVEVLASFDPPLPTMHVYAQPSDPAVLKAQQSFASDHHWFSVHRVDALSHFPQFEAPDMIARLIEDFASKLQIAERSVTPNPCVARAEELPIHCQCSRQEETKYRRGTRHAAG